MKITLLFWLGIYAIFLFSSCENNTPPESTFSKVSKSKTGIDFRNMIRESEDFNIFQYQYFYNGGGLAAGDFNNDGLQDLVFTGNMVKNRLYINKGDFKFNDVTIKSGIAEKEGWCTGVTTVDINQDGNLDIYICRAGYPFEKLRRNLLFINNGDLSFTESAAEYGLDDPAHSTHAAFFDYDRDGDLDCFLLNHSTLEYSQGALEVIQVRKKKNPEFTNKLYKNENGKFVNVTEESGITSNVLTFSLGISISDINSDGWPDIFIGNDFNEPDYLFINNQNGTFTDQLADYFDHTSMFSMGSDIADFNNDGLLDLVSLDMLPSSNFQQKMHSGMDNSDKVTMLIKNGFFKQFSRNMLQLNNGDGTFSEVGQMAGVSNTNWSWAPLFFDFNNNGNKDLFIANGYLKDHTDMDFLKFTADEVLKANRGQDYVDFDGYIDQMPPIILQNYFYQNDGNLNFINKAKDWGLDEPNVTQSAVYVDLDNDGDLDLVLNNSGDYASVLRNNSQEVYQNNYLQISLKGSAQNAFGIGTKVYVYGGGKVFFQEQFPVRGFQSTLSPILHFGLGEINKIDSLKVIWANDLAQFLQNVTVNQRLNISIKKANQKHIYKNQKASKAYFAEINGLLDFIHKENRFNDFKIQQLVPYFYSREGPCLAVADVNGDQLEDVFIGGAKGQSGKLFLQKRNGIFAEKENISFSNDAQSEDVDAVFQDMDNDGDLDLLIASGGYEFENQSIALSDRIYLNDGRGNFEKTKNGLENTKFNSSCIRPADIDGDGDFDLFVGGSIAPGKFPLSTPSRILINDGKGFFKDETDNIASEMPKKGIVKDACWIDLNNDKLLDLVVVGEWMPITFFENQNGKLVNETEKYLSFASSGLWNAVYAADFDQDGDEDLVIGNFGENSQLEVEPDKPLWIYVGDYDNNGSIDPIMTFNIDGEPWPFPSKEDLLNQLPYLTKKFTFFKTYANAKIEDILTPEQLQNSTVLDAAILKTIYLENQGGTFFKKELPVETQIAPVSAIHSTDVDGDGNLDMILAGNISNARVKLGRLNGNHGLILLGDGKGNFKKMPYIQNGLNLRGDVRAIREIKILDKTYLIVGTNNESIKMFEKHSEVLQ